MTAAATKTLAQIFTRLKEIGITSSFAKRVLPAWWDERIAETESGLQQAQLYFSRAFNIDLKSWGETDKPLQHLDVQRKFKLNKNIEEAHVSLSANYLNALAKMVLQNNIQQQKEVPQDALTLREEILKKAPCVSLSSLLIWCQEAGIPVMHVEQLPAKKMTAMVTRFNGRYAIILSKKGHAANLLFYLAHELGHIGNRHLQRDGFVADSKIESNSVMDPDEKEADAFAIRLLNGGDIRYTSSTQLASGKALYQAACTKGQQARIDVGHIILNYAYAQASFALGNTALKYIKNGIDGANIVNDAFFRGLDVDCFSEDQLELLHKVC